MQQHTGKNPHTRTLKLLMFVMVRQHDTHKGILFFTKQLRALALVTCFAAAAAYAESQPNIIILIADDLGYGETGCQGNPQIPTPHIDSIARNGVRFTQGYVTASYCSASRAGLLTGRYQTRFGYEFNPVGAENEDPRVGLPVSEKTMAQALSDLGYATALFGKWHLGGSARYHPLRRGFQQFFGFLHEGHYFVPQPYDGVTTWLRRRTLPGGGSGRWKSTDGRLVLSTHMGHDEPDYDANNPIYRDGQPMVEPKYLTDAITRESVEFIDRHANRPFFLCVAYNAVHSPMQGADQYLQRFAHIDDIHRRIFAAMLANLDDSVGAILARLGKLGIKDNTLVIFLSDNGGPTKELTSSNAPLRDGKGSMYEGGLRVPFLIQWKERLGGGKVYDEPVISLDIFPTAMAAAGSADKSERLDGVDLIPFLADKKPGRPHQHLYWRTGTRAALRSDDWKLVRNRRDKSNWELYDLKTDVSETADLAPTHGDRLRRMKEQWDAMNKTMAEPLWTRETLREGSTH